MSLGSFTSTTHTNGKTYRLTSQKQCGCAHIVFMRVLAAQDLGVDSWWHREADPRHAGTVIRWYMDHCELVIRFAAVETMFFPFSLSLGPRICRRRCHIWVAPGAVTSSTALFVSSQDQLPVGDYMFSPRVRHTCVLYAPGTPVNVPGFTLLMPPRTTHGSGIFGRRPNPFTTLPTCSRNLEFSLCSSTRASANARPLPPPPS